MLKQSLYICSLFLGLCDMKLALAETCPYEMSHLTQISSSVSRVSDEGVLLKDGHSVRMSDALLALIEPNKNFRFYGVKGLKPQDFWAFAVSSDGGKEIMCPQKAEIVKGPYPGSKEYDMIKLGGEGQSLLPDEGNSEGGLPKSEGKHP